MAYQGKLPKLAIVVDVQEVFTHCPKAFIRSKLWSEESRIDRSELPSYAEILRDHTGLVECDVEESRIDRSELPSYAEILRDHTGLVECDVEELQREIDQRVATTLH
jgi:hypothetical protein